MKNVKLVFDEGAVSNLEPGEYVMINGRRAMRRNWRGDGVDYVINNGNGTVTRMNIRTYSLSKGGIIPEGYSEKTITLKKQTRTTD